MCKKGRTGETNKTKFEFYLGETEKMATGDAMADEDAAAASTASLLHGDEEEMLPMEEEDEWESHETFIPVPKAKLPDEDLVPCSVSLCRNANGQTSSRLLRVLFDGGGTGTMIHRRVLPKGCAPTVLNNPITTKTIEGDFMTRLSVEMKDILLPEFD